MPASTASSRSASSHVDALERAGDQERRAQADTERGPCGDWANRPGEVAGGVGVGGGRGALARVDDRHHVRLPGGHVHLREGEAGEQEGDRACQVGGEGDGDQEQVGGGRWVKTIVRRSPILAERRTAAWKESACRIPIAKKTTASVCGEASYLRAKR